MEQKKQIAVTTAGHKEGPAKAKPARSAKVLEILSAQEEQVLRMRYGIGAPPDQPLEFRGQDNEETRIKLALLERAALQALQAPKGSSRKAKIVKKLTEI